MGILSALNLGNWDIWENPESSIFFFTNF
jgi:hypothetical protein